MPRIWLLLFLIVCSRLNGEEEIVSYYVGKGDSEYWVEDLFSYWGREKLETKKSDPFVKFYWEKLPAFKLLKEAPFQSRFFGKGDVLRDLSPLVNPEVGIQMVFNETSGRIVLKAPTKIQMEFGMMLRESCPEILVEGRFILMEVPLGEDPKHQWNADKFPSKGRRIHEIVLSTRSGGSVELKNPGSGIDVSWSADSGGAFHEILSKVDMKLEWSEEIFELKNEVTSLSGMPRMLASVSRDLGSLQLWYLPRVVLPDGFPLDDIVEGEEKGRTMLEIRRSAYQLQHQGEIATREGKRFRAFSVPPLDLLFGADGSIKSGDPDPFATDDVEEAVRRNSFLDQVDARIPFHPGMIAVNIKADLIKQGLEFEEGDFAVWIPNWNTVYCCFSQDNMDLLGAIFRTAGKGVTRVVEAVVREEGFKEKRNQMFVVGLFGGEPVKAVYITAGRKSELLLGFKAEEDEREIQLQLEANFGGVETKAQLATQSAKPIVASKWQNEGKERSLIVEPRMRKLGDSPTKD